MDRDIYIAVIGVIGSIATALIGKDYFKRKNAVVVDKAPKLEYHPFKVRLHELVTYLKTSYYLPNRGRMLLSRDHMIHKIESGERILMELAIQSDLCYKNCSLDGLGCNKLYNRNMEALDKIIIEYNDFINSQTFSEREKEAVEMYTRKFNEWHQDKVDRMREVITTTCSSDYYKGAGCKVRQAIIFDNYVTAYSDTIRDAEDTMARINGDLTGKEYKGEIL